MECNNISVYNNGKANEISNLLQLLNYTKSYADSVGQDQFFYPDTSTGAAEPREFTADATTHTAKRRAAYNEGFAKRKN